MPAQDNGSEPPSIAVTDDGIPLEANGRRLTEVEIGALREAKARREMIDRENTEKEVGGAKRSTEPTRYLDWEVAGRAVDFS